MKQWQKKIRNFKAEVDDRFDDKFVVKNDHTNRLVTRFEYWRKKLNRKLWYD